MTQKINGETLEQKKELSKPQERLYVLSQGEIMSLLDRAVERGAKEGVKAFKEEKRKMEKKLNKLTDKVELTKQELRDYRAVKTKLEEEVFTEDEVEELRFQYFEDLMGTSTALESRAEKKRDTEIWAYIMNCDRIRKIDKAYEQYREECEKWGSEGAKRRCREIFMLHMSEDVYKVEEIAVAEGVSDKTVYKDIGIAYKKMATYLFGF